MRRTRVLAATLTVVALAGASAQNATIVVRTTQDNGAPLAFTSVSVAHIGLERLSDERGVIVLRNLPPGKTGVRFRRIGFSPHDTVIDAIAGDTARVVVAMARLAIELPTVVVEGRCTDRTPFEEKPRILAQLFDQVRQNAERLVLLANERPFMIDASQEQGPRKRGGPAPPTQSFTRGPLPDRPYAPAGIIWRMGKTYGVKLPELADLADSAFTNNHCFWYAGQTRFGADSVVQVDFEPVPSLAKGVDLEGSLYLRVDGYRLVGMVTRLNRIPAEFSRNLVGYATSARFDELVSGIPVLAEWELTNTFRGSAEPTVVATGRVTGIRWLDAPRVDTTGTRPRR
jgi:hypothetical protein